MKNTKTCPKCGGNHILRVEDNGGVSLYLGLLSRTPVARHVCTDCGYAESWVDPQFLDKLKAKLPQEKP